MRKIIVNSCGECPCFRNNIFSPQDLGYCRMLDGKMVVSDDISKSCPLKSEPVQIEIGE